MASNPKQLARCGPSTLREAAEIGARARFRSLRIALFRTQLDAAVALGVGDASIERWEAGASRVPGWAVEALVLLAARKAVGT